MGICHPIVNRHTMHLRIGEPSRISASLRECLRIELVRRIRSRPAWKIPICVQSCTPRACRASRLRRRRNSTEVVVPSFTIAIRKHLVSLRNCLKSLRGVCTGPSFVWMPAQGLLAIGLLDVCFAGAWTDTKSSVEVFACNHRRSRYRMLLRHYRGLVRLIETIYMAPKEKPSKSQ